MHVIVNALSVDNPSGRHVLLGHLRQLARRLPSGFRFTVLYHEQNSDLRQDLGPHVFWHQCPPHTHAVCTRSLWERFKLSDLIRKLDGTILFTPAGIAYPGLDLPQIVFCQNPWSLVRDIHQGPRDLLKAALQRRAYQYAVAHADMLIFNSEYMRSAYAENARSPLKKNRIVYQGVDDSCFDKAEQLRGTVSRKQNQILTVSVMGPHKGIEIVCDALQILKSRGVAFNWKIIGKWVNPDYDQFIQSRIHKAGLADQVQILGHVSRSDLEKAYAESRIFCLMSYCESFGIPAVEAQVFGTPVVTSQGCAMPEIGGKGGVYPERGDAHSTALALEQLLLSDDLWADLSSKALSNSQRFRWEHCSTPLVEVFKEYI